MRSKRRDVPLPSSVPRRVVVLSPRPRPRLARPRINPVRQVEDRRTYHPLGPLRPARGYLVQPKLVLRSPSFNVGKSTASKPRKWYSPVFNVPSQTAICVRRKERREVLFALKRTNGAGAKHRNYWSKIGC